VGPSIARIGRSSSADRSGGQASGTQPRGKTLERLRGLGARADGELEAAQRFLDLGTRDEDEVALVKAISDARMLVGDALETARRRLEESDRG
jgi:hypothetical protein